MDDDGGLILTLGRGRYYATLANIRRVGLSVSGAPEGVMRQLLQDGFSDCEAYLKCNNLFTSS